MSEITNFSGHAASFKGERTYVHGTDILPFVDACLAAHDAGGTVTKIEFHKPLTTRGALVIDPRPHEVEKERLNASGMIRSATGAEAPFIVFASPIAVDPVMRPFDEDQLWRIARLSDDKESVASNRCAQLTTAEHVSSLMKLLCRSLLPQHPHWWFVRLQKATMLPGAFTEVEIRRKRVIASSMVSGDISFDGEYFGSIDFVGAKK